jgi:MiaB-like tRNA modifying enzyme
MESMRVFIKSFGCSANLAEGEVLAGCLKRAGYLLVGSASSAEIVVYNTCAVKGPTEDRAMTALRKVPSSKKLIVAGCLPLINFERLSREAHFDGVLGASAGERIVDVVRRVSQGERVVALEEGSDSAPDLTLPRAQSSPVVSIVPVSYGCLGSCAYCCVVFARGRLRSCGVQQVVRRIKNDLRIGIREFWITSQDVACYGRDVGTDLSALLNALSGVEGDFRVRVGMMTPNMVADILGNLVQSFTGGHFFRFVHLPVQSGDDQVLGHMCRSYSVGEFRNIVDTFRAAFPEMTLATDIICGFPGESEEAFERSLQMIEGIKPDIVNVSKFFARPRTAAASMQNDFIPSEEVKRRSAAMAKLAKKLAFESNKRWLGWEGDVLVDEVGKVPGSWVGRNDSYKPVVVKSSSNLLGKMLHVKVTGCFQTYLEGEIVE